MEDILLIHQMIHEKTNPPKNSQDQLLAEDGFFVWKTCLRRIGFVDATKKAHFSHKQASMLKGNDALIFLTEILCGLHSPIIGETEVFGQFKLFVQEQRKQGHAFFSEDQKWLQFLFTEVKKLRASESFTQGSQSYGSLTRKLLKNFDHVSILGSGHLTQEILPWLLPSKKIQIVARSRDKAAQDLNPAKLSTDLSTPIEITEYCNLQSLAPALIIAAPLKDEEIRDLLQQSINNTTRIIDLRGQLGDEKNQLRLFLPSSVELFNLENLFSELEKFRLESQERVKDMKYKISRNVQAFYRRCEFRPLGWDDLCA